jgi:hypothetical protein
MRTLVSSLALYAITIDGFDRERDVMVSTSTFPL